MFFFGKEALGNIQILLLRVVASKFQLSSWTSPYMAGRFSQEKTIPHVLEMLEILYSNKFASKC